MRERVGGGSCFVADDPCAEEELALEVEFTLLGGDVVRLPELPEPEELGEV